MGDFVEIDRNDWVFSHVYPDGLRPGVLVTERLILREGGAGGLCRWSRHLDTNDVKGVKAQGECWRRASVKTVHFSSKVGDPSREFSLYGERQAIRKRALFVWFWEKAPVLTAWLCCLFNPLTIALALCGFLTLALWSAFPKDGTRYLMSAAPDLESLSWASGLGFLTGVAALASSWWLRLGGKKAAVDTDEYSDLRPHPAALNRWCCQKGMNEILVGLLAVWCGFVCIVSPILANQGRKSDFCNVGGCESTPSNVDGICGVDTCGCGSFLDMSCSRASKLPNYCRTVDAPICAADISEASGVHALLLIMMGGTLLATMLLLVVWILNHAAIALSWKRVELLVSGVVKTEPVPYHKITLTFESMHQGSLVFTLMGEEDIATLAKVLMPDSTLRSYVEQFDFVPRYAPPPALGNFPAANMDIWPGDMDDSQHWAVLLDNPQTKEAPSDLQWD